VGLIADAHDAGVYCYLVKGGPPSLITDMVLRAWRLVQLGR